MGEVSDGDGRWSNAFQMVVVAVAVAIGMSKAQSRKHKEGRSLGDEAEQRKNGSGWDPCTVGTPAPHWLGRSREATFPFTQQVHLCLELLLLLLLR